MRPPLPVRGVFEVLGVGPQLFNFCVTYVRIESFSRNASFFAGAYVHTSQFCVTFFCRLVYNSIRATDRVVVSVVLVRPHFVFCCYVVSQFHFFFLWNESVSREGSVRAAGRRESRYRKLSIHFTRRRHHPQPSWRPTPPGHVVQ